MIKDTCFAASFLLAIFTAYLVVPSALAADSKQAPNILIMISDDQRWDQLGLVQAEQGDRARWPYIRTPHLDALASQGIRFRNAFVTLSLCSPSRSAILTGQYNHINGIIDNSTPFVARPTWATALQAEGYTTAYIGKWHHGEKQKDRPGFDYVASYVGQGQYFDTPFIINGSRNATKGYVDERTVGFAIDFLKKQGDKPFAMMVGFKAVHETFTPMPEHARDYASEVLGKTENWNSQPPWGMFKQPTQREDRGISDTWRENLRTLDGLDKNVGRLLDALDHLNLANNTLVIFTSDNGYYFGEHDLGDKRSAYEESMRVPMIARLPGEIKAGTISDAMVLNIDIAPTILDIAGKDIPAAMQGRSMRPLFAQNSAEWRKAFLYEYWQENTFWVPHDLARTPTILAVRTATHKLITYPDFPKWTELFDLEADPYETRNLVGYENSVRLHAQMCELLKQELADTDYIARPSLNKWLIGLTDSYNTYQVHARQATVARHPPMLYPAC